RLGFAFNRRINFWTGRTRQPYSAHFPSQGMAAPGLPMPAKSPTSAVPGYIRAINGDSMKATRRIILEHVEDGAG
ncbi:MAG: hypothetical protein ACREV8_12855, partial [Gammaproteobacteria bacterium]